jgi:hypothetical protein
MQLHADVSKRLDLIALACLGLIAIGWFDMDALVVSFGRFAQDTRFSELGVVLLHPAALFVGVGASHTLELWAFALLALTILFAVLAAPLLFPQREAWLAGWLPLALMLICFALLYGNGSSGQLDASASSSGLHDDLIRLVGSVRQSVERSLVGHISVGAGGVLSLLASIALALRSTLNYRALAELPRALSVSTLMPDR